jgi:tetratricopeptide (TPR) repeat protein
MGEKALLASTAAMLSQALHAQGRYDEADEFCRLCEQAAPDDDLSAQIGWRLARATLLAGEGGLEEAERLAGEAVRLAERTDFLADRAEALLGLGLVRRQQELTEEANAAIGAAIELYERKGDVVSVARARSLLNEPLEVDQ